MISPTLRILIAIFLIIHGLMHAGLTTVPLPEPGKLRTPFFPSWKRPAVDASWPVMRLGMPAGAARALGVALWLAAAALLALAGLGVLGVPGLSALWPALSLAGVLASLLMLIFFWHPWYVAAVAINLALLLALRAQWPAGLFETA